jgi:carbamoyltransferase
MKILAIQQFHDMSICLYDSETDEFNYLKCERLFNKKHIGIGSMKFYNGEKFSEIAKIKKILKDKNFLNVDVIVTIENLSTKQENLVEFNKIYEPFPERVEKDPESKTLYMRCMEIGTTGWQHSWNPYYHVKGHGRQIIKEIGIKSKKHMSICHHYAHILSSFPILKENQNYEYGVCIDGQAGPEGLDLKTVSFLKNPMDLINVESIYELRGPQSSIGQAFSEIGLKMKLKGAAIDHAGKIMGAHSYGKIDFSKINNIEKICYDFKRFTCDLLKMQNFDFNFENEDFRNFLATWHKVAELCILELFIKNIKDKKANIIYSGGVVQNSVINEVLQNEFPNITFVPHCYDGGLTLGMMYLACKYFNLNIPKLNNFPYLQYDGIDETPSLNKIKIAAKFLSNNLIVGWHQGKGEIGPRALGNRSILMHPGITDGKDKLNLKVKHRENWRPYAASVLEEYAKEWFDFTGDSPYMMRAIKVKKEKQNIIPSVVHVDGTCRIQTVSRSNNEIFYNLINEFFKLTGIPMLLNTSLNDGGKPISGSPEISEQIFYKTKMDALVIGNKIYKKNKLI